MQRDKDMETFSFSHTPSTEDQTRNPGTCPDQDSNQGPLGSGVDDQLLSHTTQEPFFFFTSFLSSSAL